MSKYTTVRIHNETMKKLEHIVENLQHNNIGKVSKALAIKHIVDCEFERMDEEKVKVQKN
ncbi:hypothetical protein [Bacillus altitudinis]|uniref:hypothetical protein n=1 Tax=Bacillus altitudinis TaxID=293387 RepID=UPI001BAB3FA2|nr:hypothetical protein [Bacillus altitudinis]MBR0628811.1 hypothetical protein [Bacillus altitudinis S70-5-12]MEE3604407.1 hypothetical protein [Bacillus altitudinis]MEE3610065.1 hypothetical protein [Bacillus altitudinis]MEE3646146.1 hypothetical protein [Bacillus altitudinis]MEE4390569.1 hypothetical protein [Bacillus altitudinis]